MIEELLKNPAFAELYKNAPTYSDSSGGNFVLNGTNQGTFIYRPAAIQDDFTLSIEPSEKGGEKIAHSILNF